MDTVDHATERMRRAMQVDPEMHEIVRAMAWCQHGAQTMRIVGGRLVGVPDGWPRCIADPAKLVADFIDQGLYTPKGDSHEQART